MFFSFGAIQFFGMSSAAPMILPFGLFFFSSAQSVRATFGLYLSCAGTYLKYEKASLSADEYKKQLRDLVTQLAKVQAELDK